ncbi:MAG TPA: thrombospondin type 3 repeat-containing protein [Candidatus Limnocylindria bacterium]|nr:thrombospondin type 3 repeat-containing protein [Candidatus Limnocylindria bacterium]
MSRRAGTTAGRLVVALVLLVPLAPRPAASSPFAAAVVSLMLGPLGGGGAVSNVLGPPHGGGAFQGTSHTLSLGLRGSIVLDFGDDLVVDGPGPDLTVFENAFLVRGATTLAPWAEPAWVSVSADGTTFRTFPCAIDVPPFFPGCAGVYPVFAADAAAALVPSVVPIESLVGIPVDDFVPPAGSGGDSFDLAAVGMASARYVRIQGGEQRLGLDGLGGFDLDAVAAVHSAPRAGADADGDGVPDAVDACPATPDPLQGDADGDGIGDACDVEAPPADGDADGVPDALDRCPLLADPGQHDTDGDGAGDACDRCPGVADPPLPDPCPERPPDADYDGAPDAGDPCPEDPACRPAEPIVFAGSGRSRAEGLLGYVLPVERRVRVPSTVTTLDLVVVVDAAVAPGSVRLRVGRRDLTDAAGPFVPGSTRTVSIPLAKRRTRVVLAARGAATRRRDCDRFTVVKVAAD